MAKQGKSDFIILFYHLILLFYYLNRSQGRVIASKKKQLQEWQHTFSRDGRQVIQSTINQLKGEMYAEIAVFAEEHFSDKKADEASFAFQPQVVVKQKNYLQSWTSLLTEHLNEYLEEKIFESVFLSRHFLFLSVFRQKEIKRKLTSV